MTENDKLLMLVAIENQAIDKNIYISKILLDIMKYRVPIEEDEDGIFIASVPELPGCISQGKTETKQ